MWTETLERGAVQHLPIIRVRDADEEFGTFLKRLAVQIHGTIFGDDPVRVGARCDHSRSWVQERNNLRLALVCAGSEGSHRHSTLGHRRALDKIQLAAGPGEYPRSDGVGADLPSQIHLRG